MTKEDLDRKWAESFFNDVEKLIDAHSDRIPEIVSILQTTVVALTCDMAPSIEEAADLLHDMIDECIDEVVDQESECEEEVASE